MKLEDLPLVYIVCLAYGHRWENAGGLMLQGGVQEDEFICRCSCRRFEQWHRGSRETVRQRWTRPDGYKLGYRVSREDAKRVLRDLGWDAVARGL